MTHHNCSDREDSLAPSAPAALIAELEAALHPRGWRIETRTANAYGLETVTFYDPWGYLMIEAFRHPTRPDQADLLGRRDGQNWLADLTAGTCARAALAAIEVAQAAIDTDPADIPGVGEALEAAGWRLQETRRRGHLTGRTWYSPDGTRHVSVNLELAPHRQLWRVRHSSNSDMWRATGDETTPPTAIAALALTDA